MKIYQLRLLNHGLSFLLEPVFKSNLGAKKFKSKYYDRTIIIESQKIAQKTDHVFRIRTIDEEGYFFLDPIFVTQDEALAYASANNINNYQIICENLLSENDTHFNVQVLEV